MLMKRITALFDRERRGEIIRFATVGVAATLMQYVLYVLFIQLLHPALANTLAYGLSFVFNYIASTRYTFRVKSNMQRGTGFLLAHAINYTLQTVLLTLFLQLGLPKVWALLPVFAVCVPTNFVLVRFFLKGRQAKPKSAAGRPGMLSALWQQLRLSRDERWPALAAAITAIALNAVVIGKYADSFMRYGKGPWGPFLQQFHVSGFDPFSYTIISHWASFYHIGVRHPLLALFFYPLSWINKGLYYVTGLNCVQLLYGLLLVAAATYSFVFLTRIYNRVVGVHRREAWLLGAYTFSFAYMLLTVCVPDHFGLSLFVLTLILWLAGNKGTSSQMGWTPWRTFWLVFLTAGLTLTNGVKAMMAALYVNGRRFWRVKFILVGIVLPMVLLLLISHYQYQWLGRPAEKARAERKAKIEAWEQRMHPERAKKKAKSEKKKKKRSSKQGRALTDDGMLQWSDVSTPRLPAAVHNLFGESLQLHADSLLQDVGQRRPVIVKYRTPIPYIVEGLIVLLFLVGVWYGRRSRFLWLVVGWFAYDMVIHFAFGFALNEVYIMTAHWAFMLPIGTAYLLRTLQGRWRKALNALLLLLTVYLWAYNTSLFIYYMV